MPSIHSMPNILQRGTDTITVPGRSSRIQLGRSITAGHSVRSPKQERQAGLTVTMALPGRKALVARIVRAGSERLAELCTKAIRDMMRIARINLPDSTQSAGVPIQWNNNVMRMAVVIRREMPADLVTIGMVSIPMPSSGRGRRLAAISR